MLVLDGASVRAALPVGEAVAVMRETMAAHARGEVHSPLRSVVAPPAMSGLAVLKPAWVGGGTDAFGAKIVTLFRDNPERGLPAVQGFVALLDAQTGELTTVIDAAAITELRTAAASAVATDLLALPEAGDLALVGAGVQARAHLLAMHAVRPLRRVRVWNRTSRRADELTSWAASEGFVVERCESVEAAVSGADLVCVATSSATPLVDGAWIRTGAHINAVGAFEPTTRELHANVLARSYLVVDSRESAAAEAGDILLAVQEGAIGEGHVQGELGELLLGRVPGRTHRDQVTLYKSLGLAVQDVAAAARVLQAALERGLGVEVPFP